MLKNYAVTVVNTCGDSKKITVLAGTVQEARQMALEVFGQNKVTVSRIIAN